LVRLLHRAFLPTFTLLPPVTVRFPGFCIYYFTIPIRIKMRLLMTCVSTLIVLFASGAPGANSPHEIAGLDFNIKNFATDAVWNRYVAKGNRLACLMTATDAGAGFLIQDSREPPSAASSWTGDLRRTQKHATGVFHADSALQRNL
jgi:hypothetical protein